MHATGGNRLPGAFTLVEMLVVIGIIGILVAMVVPALAAVRAETQSTHCLSNLRQVYTAIESHRAGNGDLLPIAAILQGDAVDPDFVMLAERLDPIMPRESEVWMCPGDHTLDSEEIGTSYYYSPGGWMLSEPLTDRVRVRRIITQRYDNGFLRTFPLAADNDGYHDTGNRFPCNAVFIDGHARVMKESDLNFIVDETNQLPDPDDPGAP